MFKVEDARITLGKYDRGYCIVLVDILVAPDLIYMRTAVYKDHLFRTKLMR